LKRPWKRNEEIQSRELATPPAPTSASTICPTVVSARFIPTIRIVVPIPPPGSIPTSITVISAPIIIAVVSVIILIIRVHHGNDGTTD
jgi:hypothetical protein